MNFEKTPPLWCAATIRGDPPLAECWALGIKNPAARPGFALRGDESQTAMLGLIFRDNRGRSEQIEFVIESDLDLVLPDVAVSNEAKPREG